MDVDKAIEFLLSESARLDARQAQFNDQLRTMARLGMAMSRRAFTAIAAVAEQQRSLEAGLAQQRRELEASLIEQRSNLEAGLAEHRSNLEAGLAKHRSNLEAGLAEHRRAQEASLAEHRREMDAGRRTLEASMAALAEQQRRTEAKLEAFIENTERRWGGDGHAPHPG